MLLLSVCLWVEIVEVHLINFVGEDRLIPNNLRSKNQFGQYQEGDSNLRRWQYGCKFLSNARLQGRRENHVELKYLMSVWIRKYLILEK